MIAEECELEERPVVVGLKTRMTYSAGEGWKDGKKGTANKKLKLVGPAEEDGAGGVACADCH